MEILRNEVFLRCVLGVIVLVFISYGASNLGNMMHVYFSEKRQTTKGARSISTQIVSIVFWFILIIRTMFY